MVLSKRRKTPTETFLVGAEFKNRLGQGETISTPTITSRKLSDNSDSTATFLQGAAQIDPSGTLVKRRILAGADGDTHRVRYVVETNAGNTFEASQDWMVIAD